MLATVAIALNGKRVSGEVPARAQALLCCLAATGRPHSRDKLAGLLWGDKPEARAKANLRKSPSTLQKLYGDALSITRQTDGVQGEPPLLGSLTGEIQPAKS